MAVAVCAWPSGVLASAVTISPDYLSVLTPELFQHIVYLLILEFLYKDILETLGYCFLSRCRFPRRSQNSRGVRSKMFKVS